MDPDANIDEQIKLANEIIALDAGGQDITDQAHRLAELVESLDHWITGGGALPTRWHSDAPFRR